MNKFNLDIIKKRIDNIFRYLPMDKYRLVKAISKKFSSTIAFGGSFSLYLYGIFERPIGDIDIVVRSKDVNKINKWFKIGRPILVEGYLTHQKEWTNKEGKIIREMMVKISKWEFMDNKGKNENNSEIPESAGKCGTEETTPEDFDSIVEEAVKSD